MPALVDAVLAAFLTLFLARLAAVGRPVARAWQPALAAPDRPPPADGLPADVAEHMRLMCDVLVLAFGLARDEVLTPGQLRQVANSFTSPSGDARS